MDTVRVDIAYRPLRVVWAIHSGDKAALRQAVRLTHTLWGGRYNPIVLVDRPEEAKQLVEAFRADLIYPIGEDDAVKQFPKQFPHLIDPLYGGPFLGGTRAGATAQLLDIHNALAHWHDTAGWKPVLEQGVRVFEWEEDDPLSDVFLMWLGRYPDAADIGIDYAHVLGKATMAIQERIHQDRPIPTSTVNHPSIGYLTKHELTRHYTIRSAWKSPGFYIGDAADTLDLVSYWNLRAADVSLHFVDLQHVPRFAETTPRTLEHLRAGLLHRDEHERRIAVWSRFEAIDAAKELLPDQPLVRYDVSDGLWNGYNLRPPMMILGSESALGVIGKSGSKPRVSFALNDKPFSGDSWFYSQHLVASVSLLGGLYEDDHHTFLPPYAPELNEFLARHMYFHYDKLRIEPKRIGLIINATDHDIRLDALPVADLFEKIFDLAGLKSHLSSGGLITRQLIARLGGVRGGRVFKIPGVRRLLRTYGPMAPFTKRAAHNLIASKDPKNPGASFADHENLFIEPRLRGSKLTAQMVFEFLVEKGLFRIGAQLTCPSCRLKSWVALDNLQQSIACELCGDSFDTTRQLVGGEFAYRRTGVLGLEKNTQGAVPVALVLEQLTRALRSLGRDGGYIPSFDLEPKPGVELPMCEIDFGLILNQTYPKKAQILLGECKDEGTIDAKDIENLKLIADALPKERYETFIVLAKLCAFTSEEIALAKTLNDKWRRVILLTSRELEPYFLFERLKKEFAIRLYEGTPQALADVTHQIYFAEAEGAE